MQSGGGVMQRDENDKPSGVAMFEPLPSRWFN